MNTNNNIFDSFDLPEDYFSKSKSSILNRIEWEDEHSAYPNLLELKNKHGFLVPTDYFTRTSTNTELLAYPILLSNNKKSGFAIPEAYFEKRNTEVSGEMPDDLMDFTLLNTLSKVNQFAIPENYFTNNAIKLEQVNAREAKIIPLNKKPLWFAAAAVLTIVLSVWLYSAFFNVPIAADEDCHTLACIEKKELLKYKLDQFENEDLYEMVNTEKLKENLNSELVKDTLLNADTIDELLLDIIE